MEPDRPIAPSVVAVVVVHQPGPWFDDTLAALGAQDYPSLRHLFLVDAAAGAEELAELTGRIRSRIPSAFVRTAAATGSFGAIANDVLRLVEGDNGFFLLCHDDIAPAPDAVRLLVNELYRSNAGIVGPKLVEWDEPRRLQHVGLQLDRFGEIDPLVEPGELDQEQHDAVRDVFALPSACILVRADLFRLIGGYEPSISFHGDDVDLCWRAHLTGARVVIAPDARVRHRERLEDRRPDLDHRRLRSRHRMRNVAVLTGPQRVLGRSLQLILLALVELVVGLFTGRLSDAFSSARALGGLIPATPALLGRRRRVAPLRTVPEREILGLQLRGSARLASYVRGRETTTYIGAGSAVRRWRDTSYAPLLTWFLLLTALVIGSRSLIDRGVLQVGEFLAFPDSPRRLLDLYLSGWDGRGLGATTALPTGVATLAGASVLAGFRMELAMTMSVLGLVLVGAAGAWRLAGVFPVTLARVGVTVVYVAAPLVPGMLATGRWSGLVWFATLPWGIHLLRRVVGIGTADPQLADVDLVDGIAEPTRRDRVRLIALASLVIAIATAFVPVIVVLWWVVGLVLAAATLIAGGALRTSGWFLGGATVSAVVAVVLNLPWASTWTWSGLMEPALAGARGSGLVGVASLAVDGRTFGSLGLALYVPFVAALAITGAWRLTWAVRAAGLVLVFGGVAVLVDHDVWSIALPDPALLLVPVALGLALSAGSVAGGFADDVRRRGFGWRQPAAIIANLAIVVGIVPAAVAIGDGAWGAPRSTLATTVAAQLPSTSTAGDYRVLFIGDPRVLPIRGVEHRPGVARAVVPAGPLDFTQRWNPPRTSADEVLDEILDLIADGSTLRAGRLLAPLGIRFVVVPEIDGAASTVAEPLPLPNGLLVALRAQLDLGETFGAPTVHVFENRSWMPLTALLSGPTAEASRRSGTEALIGADLGLAAPLLPALDPLGSDLVEAGAGVVHLGIPFDERWTVSAGDVRLPAREGFGATTAFDLDAPATLGIEYEPAPTRRVAVVLQTLAWLLVLVAASRLRVPVGRGGVTEVHDDTLIDLAGDIGLDEVDAGLDGDELAWLPGRTDDTGPVPGDPTFDRSDDAPRSMGPPP